MDLRAKGIELGHNAWHERVALALEHDDNVQQRAHEVGLATMEANASAGADDAARAHEVGMTGLQAGIAEDTDTRSRAHEVAMSAENARREQEAAEREQPPPTQGEL
jgi:hypothetical protein